jgi:hypothetical protein
MTNLLQFTVNVPKFLNGLSNPCVQIACCPSELIFTFLYADSSTQNASEQFVSCIHVSFENFALYRQTPHKVRSADSNNSISVTIQNYLDICSCELLLTVADTVTPANIDFSSLFILYIRYIKVHFPLFTPKRHRGGVGVSSTHS